MRKRDEFYSSQTIRNKRPHLFFKHGISRRLLENTEGYRKILKSVRYPARPGLGPGKLIIASDFLGIYPVFFFYPCPFLFHFPYGVAQKHENIESLFHSVLFFIFFGVNLLHTGILDLS